jgi:hypothetical protein
MACLLLALLPHESQAQEQSTSLRPLVRLTAPASPVGVVGYATAVSLLAGDLIIFTDGTLEYRESYAENFYLAQLRQVSPSLLPGLTAILGRFKIGQRALVCRPADPLFGPPLGVAPTAESPAFLYWYGKNRMTTQVIEDDPAAAACPSDLTALLNAVLTYAQNAGLLPPSQLVQSAFTTPASPGTALSATVRCADGQGATGTARLYAGAHLACTATACQPSGSGTLLAQTVLDGTGKFTVAVPAHTDPRVLFLDIVADSGSCTGSLAQPYLEFSVNQTVPWARVFEVQFSDSFRGIAQR